MYYRPNVHDNLPFDFCPIVNTGRGKVISIDIPKIRRPIPNVPVSQYLPGFIVEEYGKLQNDLKPLEVIQPEGFHIGFNYREGLVLNNVVYNDHGNVRPLFWRMSIAEMLVPYGCPEFPHTRKHAFDLGEYGARFMANSLSLSLSLSDAIAKVQSVISTPLSTCATETPTRSRTRSVFTKRFRHKSPEVGHQSNFYCCQLRLPYSFHTDGNIQRKMKLTGILSTYVVNLDEKNSWVGSLGSSWRKCTYYPQLEGNHNSISPFFHPRRISPNKYGNAFYSKNTVYKTARDSIADYNSDTGRTWAIISPNRNHPATGTPVSYKLVSREVPYLLPKEGGLVWKRGGFARHAVHITLYAEDQLYPAGKYVSQTSGEPSLGLPQWLEDASSANIENADVVLWHTFGLTHFRGAEDFPLMPAESVSLI